MILLLLVLLTLPAAAQPVPNVVGLPVDEARARLQALELEVAVLTVRSQAPAGEVVSQAPTAGADGALRARLFVSGGPEHGGAPPPDPEPPPPPPRRRSWLGFLLYQLILVPVVAVAVRRLHSSGASR